jgi:general stress protein YciG
VAQAPVLKLVFDRRLAAGGLREHRQSRRIDRALCRVGAATAMKGVGNDMDHTTTTRTRNRGFASMDTHRQREIARKGGRAAHEKGKAHEFTPDEARAAGRKGGEKVSVNRKHMAEIGRRGGRSSAQRRRPDGQEGNGSQQEATQQAGSEQGAQSNGQQDGESA